MVASDKLAEEVAINLAFGTPPGFSADAYLALHLSLTAVIGTIACILTVRFFKPSNVSLSTLWSLYYIVGLIFHACAWLSGDAQSYAFLGLTMVHVYVEMILCIKSLESKPELVNWWSRRASLYFLIAGFLSLLLWRPLYVFVLGSLLVLPVDILVLPAALAVMQRAKDKATWWLGLVWSLNCPIILLFFGMIVWGAKATNTHVALCATLLQVQYIVMGIMWISTFGRLDPSRVGMVASENEDCIELGILPTSKHGGGTVGEQRPLVASALSSSPATTSTSQGGMAAALRMTLIILTIEFGIAVLLPLLLGKIDLGMMLTNGCMYFKPGNIPIECA